MKFISVNMPFSAADVDYDEELPYFEKRHSLKPGMFLDCRTEYEDHTMILIGHVNSGMGTCGCCPNTITYVYRYAMIEMPPVYESPVSYPYESRDLVDIEVSQDGETWELYMVSTYGDWLNDTMRIYDKHYPHARIVRHKTEGELFPEGL